jgi:adenylate cyclase
LYILENMKLKGGNSLFSISLIIFLSFSVIFLILTVALIGYSYIKISRDALVTADYLMEKTSKEIFMKIENLYDPLLYVADQADNLPILADKPTLQNHRGEKFFMKTMETYRQIQSLFIGYRDGDFYEVISFYGDSTGEIRKMVSAPEEALYAVLRQFTPPGQAKPVRLWKFVNREFQTIGSAPQRVVSYDPRLRPWYIKARDSQESIKTDPYLFANINKTGLTIAHRIDGVVPGILGVDILLDEISLFLQEQSRETGGLILIFNRSHVISSSSLFGGDAHFSERDAENFLEILPETATLGDEVSFTMKKERVSYLIKIRKLPEPYSNGDFLFIAIPRNRILASIGHTAKETSFLSLLLVMGTFPLIFYLSRKISFPLTCLENEAAKIAGLNLEEDIEINSFIKEIHNLTVEMTTMKRGIRSLNKYVPTKHVRNLMFSASNETIGGISREMTFLFSDIQGFTNIAEKSTPEELLSRLSEYFDVVSRDIRQCNGTVDKYIGDAVMAFWNAPDEDRAHPVHACEAALNMQASIAELNERFREYGKEPFITRIGIDSGVAMVGNVGSSQRMNYTAIGDTVNSTSRLESINKLYKTHIIAGESVIAGLSEEFLYRPLEKIIVKGKSESQIIYELMGYADQVSQGRRDFADIFREAFDLYYRKEWGRAEKQFLRALELEKGDFVLDYFALSCRALIEEPPGDDWDGIRVLSRK